MTEPTKPTKPTELTRMERNVITFALRKYREHLLHYARANPAQEHLMATTAATLVEVDSALEKVQVES